MTVNPPPVKHLCAKDVYRGRFSSSPCARTAKVERNGKHYCGIHDPVSVAEKRAKRDAEWRAEEEEDRQNAAAIFRASIQTENERRLALFDEMLEALKLASSIIGHPDDSVSQSIVELIAKAEEKS